MTGGLLQLSAKGREVNMMFGNPSMTCFLKNVRKKTIYATEFIPNSFQGRCTFGQYCKIKVFKEYGDVINKMFLKIKLPEVPYTTESAWIDEIGHMIIDTVEFRINGITIDTHTGLYLSVYNKLVLSGDQSDGYNKMIGNVSELKGTTSSMITGSPYYIPSRTLYTPLQFWFNKEKNAGLPVVAMHDAEMEIIVKFRELEDLLKGDPILGGLQIEDCKLYSEYIFLERGLRKCFLDLSHDYLIEQVQIHEETLNKKSTKVNITFNHPVKEIISIIQDNSYFSKTDIDKSLTRLTDDDDKNPLEQFLIQINGVDRFRIDDGEIFNWVLPYYFHSNIPPDGLNIYNFSSTPQDTHPTGVMNFSKIDNVIFTYKITDTASNKNNKLTIFAQNYNILRIQNRTAGLVFYT